MSSPIPDLIASPRTITSQSTLSIQGGLSLSSILPDSIDECILAHILSYLNLIELGQVENSILLLKRVFQINSVNGSDILSLLFNRIHREVAFSKQLVSGAIISQFNQQNIVWAAASDRNIYWIPKRDPTSFHTEFMHLNHVWWFDIRGELRIPPAEKFTILVLMKPIVDRYSWLKVDFEGVISSGDAVFSFSDNSSDLLSKWGEWNLPPSDNGEDYSDKLLWRYSGHVDATNTSEESVLQVAYMDHKSSCKQNMEFYCVVAIPQKRLEHLSTLYGIQWTNTMNSKDIDDIPSLKFSYALVNKSC